MGGGGEVGSGNLGHAFLFKELSEHKRAEPHNRTSIPENSTTSLSFSVVLCSSLPETCDEQFSTGRLPLFEETH